MTALSKPTIRTLSSGVLVVDYGPVWFRVELDGKIMKRVASAGRVQVCEPTKGDIRRVRAALQIGEIRKAWR